MTDNREFVFPDNYDRSIILVEDLREDFQVEALVVDGEKISKKIGNLSLDLGAVGDVLESEGAINLLELPVNDDGSWNEIDSGMAATIMTADQQKELNISIENNTRVGVIENKNKRIFFRVPENDVAEFFEKKFKSNNDREESIKYLIEHKETVGTGGEESIKLGRIIYGLWNDAVDKSDFARLDETMEKIYPETLPGATESIDSIFTALQVSLKNEAVKPADNWWLARVAMKKMLIVLEKESHTSDALSNVCRMLDLVAEKTFYPQAYWKAIAEPLTKINYEGGNLLSEINNNDEYVFARNLISQINQ